VLKNAGKQVPGLLGVEDVASEFDCVTLGKEERASFPLLVTNPDSALFDAMIVAALLLNREIISL
jgi:hypothetical protein